MGVTTQGYGQEGYVLQDEQVQPRPPDEALDFAVGVPYFLPFATPYRDSWEVFRDDPVSIRQLITMRRRDGQARALYRLLTKPLLSAMKNADVVPIDGTTGGVKEAQFCKDLLFAPKSQGGMTHSFDKFVKQMLLALFNGYSAWEMVYWRPKTGPNKGKYTLRKLDWRPGETLTFLLDGQGEFNGFRQRTFFQGRAIDVKIEKETALYYAHEEAERPFYGLPTADWTVQTLNESASRFDFLGMINHHNSQMSKSVLAQWFDNEQGGGSGDSTLVDFGKQDDVTFFLMLEGILEEMAQVISDHIFPRFVDWNFGTEKYPQFKWGPLTEEAKSAIQDTFDKIATAGPQANVTPEFALELESRMAQDFGFDIDYDKIKADREKQAKTMQQAAQKQAQAAAANPAQVQGAGQGSGGGQAPAITVKIPTTAHPSSTGTSASGGSGLGANTKGNGLGG
jgi:hypothetical protein